jgi:hypothetical protein
MVGAQRAANIAVREYSFIMNEEDLPDPDATSDGDAEESRNLARRTVR